MSMKTKFLQYGIPVALLVALLALLPPILVPYFGFAGTYVTYAVTGVVCLIALFVSERVQKIVD